MNIAQHLSHANTLDTCVTMKEGLNKNNTSMYITNHPDFQYLILLEASCSTTTVFFHVTYTNTKPREMIDIPSTDS